MTPGVARLVALVARALTLFRIVGLPPFVAIFLAGDRPTLLVVLFALFALSDFLDGRLARLADAASPAWGRIDVAADVLFNAVSLGAAARLGLVGPWVPAAVAVLGARYLWRSRRTEAVIADGSLDADRPGKIAGVLFYVLVGVAVGNLALGVPPRTWLRPLGDAVFLYALFVLARPYLGRLARTVSP